MKHPDDKSDKLVAQLEELLEVARKGEITDFAFALVYADRRVAPYWSQTTDKWRLVGAVEALKVDLMGGGD